MGSANVAYVWTINRIRSIATSFGLLGSICVLSITTVGIVVLVIVSLIPLYLDRETSEGLGELYSINNYSLVVAFQIPQYNTTFALTTTTTAAYQLSGLSENVTVNSTTCVNPISIITSQTIATTENCDIQLLSLIYPAVPNARVFNSYALSQACYTTLQSCQYDRFLTACLISDCTVVTSLNTSTNGSFPVTSYRLHCKANVYYSSRCVDAPAISRLYSSSGQQNSVCRQQRLTRINSCLNSSVSLSNVPSMISVSSGRVTYKNAVCTETISCSTLNVNMYAENSIVNDTIPIFVSTSPSASTLNFNISSETFSASDQTDGHPYRISSVQSETYMSTQLGAVYSGGITLTQIATSITSVINSQTS